MQRPGRSGAPGRDTASGPGTSRSKETDRDRRDDGQPPLTCEIGELSPVLELVDESHSQPTLADLGFDPAYGAVPETEERSSSRASTRRKTARDPLRGQHLLIVDDEKLLVSSTTRMLHRLGYEAEGAEGALEALALFERDPKRFELVITDYRMPGLSGIELARRMSSLRPDLPILLVSGYTDEIDVRDAVRAGIRQVLSKPLTASDFEVCLDRLLAGEFAWGAPPP